MNISGINSYNSHVRYINAHSNAINFGRKRKDVSSHKSETVVNEINKDLGAKAAKLRKEGQTIYSEVAPKYYKKAVDTINKSVALKDSCFTALQNKEEGITTESNLGFSSSFKWVKPDGSIITGSYSTNRQGNPVEIKDIKVHNTDDTEDLIVIRPYGFDVYKGIEGNHFYAYECAQKISGNVGSIFNYCENVKVDVAGCKKIDKAFKWSNNKLTGVTEGISEIKTNKHGRWPDKAMSIDKRFVYKETTGNLFFVGEKIGTYNQDIKSTPGYNYHFSDDGTLTEVIYLGQNLLQA